MASLAAFNMSLAQGGELSVPSGELGLSAKMSYFFCRTDCNVVALDIAKPPDWTGCHF